MRDNKNKRRAAALAVTVALHAALLLVLTCIFLRYDSAAEPPEWPPADSSELLFGGDIVKIGNFGAEQEATVEGTSPEPLPDRTGADEPQPAPAQAENMVASNRPSPAKAQADAEAEARELAEAARRRAQADAERRRREEIASRVAFGKGTSAAGQPDGTASTGKVQGISASGLGNRRAIDTPAPPQGPMGQIVVKINVDRSGKVVSATIQSGQGAAGASAASRNACVAAARNSRFTAAQTAPEIQTGYLTYNFK